jgi:hypothetical protein
VSGNVNFPFAHPRPPSPRLRNNLCVCGFLGFQGSIRRPCSTGTLVTAARQRGRSRCSCCSCTPAPSRGDWSITWRCSKRVRPIVSPRRDRDDHEDGARREPKVGREGQGRASPRADHPPNFINLSPDLLSAIDSPE